ncbi:MAG: PepSY domain-containing protein [Candidatus Eremiobacteraeota bacterium]|nr:PepSY domain-containing protein [Candidatus Eremiobacteraeota bacterium]
MKTLTFAALLVASTLAAASAATSPTPALKGAQFQSRAKVSLKAAQMKALSVERGVIVGQELEKEAGGLRYSFDVKVGKVTHEVGVDAATGKVLEDSIDTGND